MKLSQVVLDDWFRIIFTGEQGTGKSIAALSFPRPYVFDLDGRVRSLVNYYGADAFPDADVEYYGPEDYVRFVDDFNRLVVDTNSKYDTFVIDSLTAFARMVLNYSIGLRGKDKGKTKGIVNIVDIDDYNAEDQMISDLLATARQLKKKHFILTAHLLENFKGKRTLLTGGRRIRSEATAYFDEVWNFYTDAQLSGKPKHFVSTVPIGVDNAKTALPLPPQFDWTNEKNFYQLLRKLLEGKVPEASTNQPSKKVLSL